MGVIYKITNNINNKIYIGQTINTEPVRWQQHVYWSNHIDEKNNDSPYLINAIHKYGKDNFTREILFETTDLDLLNQKEQEYIELYNSTNRDIGYNIDLGGQGHCLYKTEDIYDLYQQYQSVSKVSEILGCDRNTVSHRLNSIGIDTDNTIVLQYDINGNFIELYSSWAEAKNKNNFLIKSSVIPASHYYNNYFWLYQKDNLNINEIIDTYKNGKNKSKTIEQYDTHCNLIQQFSSAAEASRLTGINVSNIKDVLSGRSNLAGGYIWHKPLDLISLEERYKKYLLSRSCCEVEEIDKNGNVIGNFSSGGKLEKENNWSYNCVKRVCDGKQKTAYGRYFRYAHPDKRKLLNERRG